MRVVVFTDLDGTLLDHRSYSFRMALPALDLLSRRRIPVVPVSSKTAAEIRLWMKQLNLHGPFICENGGGIIIPQGYFHREPEGAVRDNDDLLVSLGKDIGTVRSDLGSLALEWDVNARGLGEMTPAEVSELTGLKGDELKLSMDRRYDEPFTADPDPGLEAMREAASNRGLTVSKGGRFYHLAGGCDKGKAVQILLELFKERDPDTFSIGIGDSENDLAMLRTVQRAFLVRRSDGSYDPDVPVEAAARIQGTGPAGWRMAIESVFAEIGPGTSPG